jgi:tRNA (guanine37-N1)-methyltransferase
MKRRRLLNKVAEETLTKEEALLLGKGFDRVGDICIIKIPKMIEKKKFELAKVLLQEMSPSIKVILGQTSPVQGDYRTRDLEWLAGEKRTSTVYKEHGCKFSVDLTKVYFSPRLSYERMRLVKLIQQSQRTENVINMFAGVGSFSIIIAAYCKSINVYSIDINPEAVRFMEENIRVNKVSDRVMPILGDAKTVINEDLQNVADRVLMPLPEKACEYLGAAVSALKLGIGFIHYYDVTYAKKGEKPVDLIARKVDERMSEIRTDYEVISSRIVRTVGPNWHQVVLDIKIVS